MLTLWKMGLSGYNEITCFWAFQCKYRIQNSLFLWGKFLDGTRHMCEKNEPPTIVLGGRGCMLRPADSKPNKVQCKVSISNRSHDIIMSVVYYAYCVYKKYHARALLTIQLVDTLH